ncbi:unnamed protein product [Urochloa humidicola]
MASPAAPPRWAPLRQDAAAGEQGAGPDIAASLVAPPRWFLLLRDAPARQHAAGEGEGAGPEVTASLVAPPGVSILAVPAALHPDPLECDLHPYVVAADPAAGLLLHIARWPIVGFDLDASPDRTGCLLVVRGFVPTSAAAFDGIQGVKSSAVLRVPDRPEPPAMAPISSVKCLGLVSLPGSGGADYVVAELRVDAGVRSEYALKKRERFVLSHEDALKKLEEGRLQVVSKPKDDSSWNKIQIVLYGVLVTGLTVLAQFWPWMPSEVLQAVPIAFATVWVLGCIALPFALFGAKKWEISFSHHAARVAFLCFSTFVLYGLYRMSVDPTPASAHSGTPTASHPVSHAWGWMECVYSLLELVSILGQGIAWFVDWRRGDTDP